MAAIGNDRLCHGDLDASPTCYEAASAAFGGRDPATWQRLKAHWADVQVETLVEVERHRRDHPDIYSFGPPSPHLLATIMETR